MKVDELSRLLLAADPAAVLVAPPVLERVIRRTTGLSWAAWSVPHARCFLIDRFTLFKHVEQDELELPPDHQLPQTVLLLERPTADRLAGQRDELLGRYWRLLFHVTVHRELEAKLPAAVRTRIERLGPAAFEEARNVLTQDGQLTPGADDRQAYIEFAAYYLELRKFAWNLVGVTFPSLPPVAHVDALLAEDVDAGTVFAQTRLTGAPAPAPRTDDQADESHDYYYRLARAARRAAVTGDTVNAAILHTRAARVAPAALTEPVHAAAVKDVHNLVARLQPAVGLTDAEADRWREVLPALLDKADQGSRPVEAGLLFDLQRACLDHEQKIYTLDVVEWVLSAGHRPIRRELDGLRFVRVPAHLRAAARKLTAARLNDADRQALTALLRDALGRSEERLRARFRPVLTDALQDAGLRPALLPERAALAKTVEELLDRISAAGFLTFADLRDAIARGQVKLPDLSGTDEYLRGDLLLRLDRRLATLLDGVYRRSEFYVRWLERGTSLLFGTESGRWITRNLLLPVGGAFLTGQFVWLLKYERERKVEHLREALPSGGPPEPATAATPLADPSALVTPAAPPAREPVDLSFFGGWNADWRFHLAWLGLAVVLLALVRSARLRSVARRAGSAAYRAARAVLWDLPLAVWADPRFNALMQSPAVQIGWHYLIKPAALSGVVWAAFPTVWQAGWATRLMTVLASALLLNSRVGYAAEAVVGQSLAGLVRLIRAGLIPGLVRWVAEVFRECIGALEWVLARGDDWLRLRGAGGPITVAVRAVAGLVWFPFAFLLRFYLVVLIEPMVNPLKLPLSVLFAKFVYPLLLVVEVLKVDPDSWLGFNSDLVGKLAPVLTQPVAWTLVIGTLYLLPDAVTFLFWETRENWKLYTANRPVSLGAVAVGPHGETVAGLLRPGFHSGTVPRLYARLRAAERHGARAGEWADARAYRERLREVAGGVGRFVSRELAAVLNDSPAWGGRDLSVGTVHLGTNRIRVELRLAGADTPAVLEWEDRSGWLVVGWAEPGWVTALTDGLARTFENALAYLYKRAGVDLVREQVRTALPPSAVRFDVVPAGLLVWYGLGADLPVLYDLSRGAIDLKPRTADGLKPAAGPTLAASALAFNRVKLTWPGWLGVWPADAPVPPRFAPPAVAVVPASPQIGMNGKPLAVASDESFSM
ncbi:MAG: hypothetical protein U0871_03650 [Gemmataceae bacterium]